MQFSVPIPGLSANAPGKLHVLRHDGDSLAVNGTKIGILEEANKVSFTGLLKSSNRSSLKAIILDELTGNLSDQTLKRKLADEKLGGFLKFANLAKRDSSRAKAVGLLDLSGGTLVALIALGTLHRTRVVATSSFASSLVSSCHRFKLVKNE